MIPDRIIILLSGVPATGKSTFGRRLACDHDFAHYDLEADPRVWPRPELKDTWDKSRPNFVAALRQFHKRVALDWGFPPLSLSWVQELQREGVQLVWFDGDRDRAREVFVERGGSNIADFEKQLKELRDARFPQALQNYIYVEALSNAGFLDHQSIENRVFENVAR